MNIISSDHAEIVKYVKTQSAINDNKKGPSAKDICLHFGFDPNQSNSSKISMLLKDAGFTNYPQAVDGKRHYTGYVYLGEVKTKVATESTEPETKVEVKKYEAPKKELNETQQQIIDYVDSYFIKNNKGPSMNEIFDHFGFRSYPKNKEKVRNFLNSFGYQNYHSGGKGKRTGYISNSSFLEKNKTSYAEILKSKLNEINGFIEEKIKHNGCTTLNEIFVFFYEKGYDFHKVKFTNSLKSFFAKNNLPWKFKQGVGIVSSDDPTENAIGELQDQDSNHLSEEEENEALELVDETLANQEQSTNAGEDTNSNTNKLVADLKSKQSEILNLTTPKDEKIQAILLAFQMTLSAIAQA